MWYVVAGIGAIIGLYLFVNGSRNSDPLNRKCAAEICEYVTSAEDIDPERISEIFKEHARYQKQANHIVSMVPTLLIKAGYPQDAAMSIVPVIRSAAMMQPR